MKINNNKYITVNFAITLKLVILPNVKYLPIWNFGVAIGQPLVDRMDEKNSVLISDDCRRFVSNVELEKCECCLA